MRVAIDIRWLQEAVANRALGGIGRYSLNLTTRLLPHIEAVLFASPDLPLPPALAADAAGGSAEIVAIPNCWRLPGSRLGLRALSVIVMDGVAVRRASERAAVDVVHFMHQLSPPPRRIRCPTVVTVHDLAYLTHPELFFPAAKVPWLYGRRLRSLDRATRLIAVSEATARDVEALLGIPRRRIAVIHEAPDAVFSPEGRAADVGWPYFLHVGGAGPGKNLRTLMRAWALLPTLTDDPGRLLVVGVRDDQLPVTLPDRVDILPYVSDEELAAYYRGAVALVYPSLVEGFGLPVLEAMACGTPVVTSARTATREVAGDAGLLIDDPGDVERLARLMLDLLRNAGLRRELSRAGVARAGGFTWPDVCERTLAVYQEAVRDAQSPRARRCPA